MEFNEVLALRKSVRRYTKEIVSQEDEKAMIDAAMASSVGKHNDGGYNLVVVRDREILDLIAKEEKEAVDYLMRYDAGIIAEHIHLKAAELGLGSVILFGFIRHLGENAEYIKKMNLPEGVYPLLGVAVGHGPGSAVKRKDDRHFKVLRME